ncbi:MAG: general stress protein [Neobacillus sp.]
MNKNNTETMNREEAERKDGGYNIENHDKEFQQGTGQNKGAVPSYYNDREVFQNGNGQNGTANNHDKEYQQGTGQKDGEVKYDKEFYQGTGQKDGEVPSKQRNND